MFFLDFVIPFVAHCRQEMDMCFCFVCIGDWNLLDSRLIRT